MDGPLSVCFLRNRGNVLSGRYDDPVRWDAPAGRIEGDPDTTARQVVDRIVERPDAVSFVRAGDPIDAGERIVHPYLFDAESRGTTTDFGTIEWIHPTDIRRRRTGAGLWTGYEAVAPTVETVRADETHGSAYISVRALEVLRDRATTGDWSGLVDLARELLDARPSMAALENRVNRAMFEAETPRTTAVERAARAGIERAVAADDWAATRAANAIEGTVLTLSRSGTVESALLAADPDEVVVLESRPDREGVDVAERLADAEIDATVTLDGAVAHSMKEINAVLVGADTVLADGSVVNKVGTRTAAVAAAREGVPVYAVAAADKISSATEPTLEPIYGDEGVEIDAPLFDHTPADLVTGVITEEGVFDTGDVAERAAEREHWSGWSKGPNAPAE